MNRVPTSLQRAFARLRGPYARLALLTAVAATLAYLFGILVPQVSSVVAAITALIAVRPTFHASMQEALRQVLGVIVGGAVAFVAILTIGITPIAVLLAVLASYLAARLLKIGEEGAAALAVTVILVVGPTFNAEAVESRLLGVVVGSLLALLVSLYTRPGKPHERALDSVLEQAERTSRLLTKMAEHLARHDGRVSEDAARGWLEQANATLRRIAEIRDSAEDAVAGSRWSPLLDRQEAQAVLDQVLITRTTALMVESMCLDILAAADRGTPMPAHVASDIAGVLLATADVISEQSGTARENPAEGLPPCDDALVGARTARKEAAATIRDLDETAPLLLGGSLLRDTEKISEVLSAG